MKVTYEFDPFEDQSELKMFQRASEYHSTLWDISQDIRSYNKYNAPGEEAPIEEQLKQLKIVFAQIEEHMGSHGIWDDV